MLQKFNNLLLPIALQAGHNEPGPNPAGSAHESVSLQGRLLLPPSMLTPTRTALSHSLGAAPAAAAGGGVVQPAQESVLASQRMAASQVAGQGQRLPRGSGSKLAAFPYRRAAEHAGACCAPTRADKAPPRDNLIVFIFMVYGCPLGARLLRCTASVCPLSCSSVGKGVAETQVQHKSLAW